MTQLLPLSEVAGTALTADYADNLLLDPAGILSALWLFNSCDQTILLSFDGGVTTHFKLESNEGFTWDAKANLDDIRGPIRAKHDGIVPGMGSLRLSAVRRRKDSI